MATGLGSIGRSSVVGSDFIYDNICTRCHSRNGSHSEAAYYCPQCDVYYCKPCIQHACDHGILGRAEMKRWGHPTDHNYIPRSRVGEDTVNPVDQELEEKMSDQVSEESQSDKPKKARQLPNASKVRVTGPGVENGLFSNFVSKFKIETHGAGPGQLTVYIRGPKGHFQVGMFRENRSERNFYCRYDPTSCGQYIIKVAWSGEHVPGSPFHVHLCETSEELKGYLTSDTYV